MSKLTLALAMILAAPSVLIFGFLFSDVLVAQLVCGLTVYFKWREGSLDQGILADRSIFVSTP